jgi:hypothetical protein
VSNGWAFHPTFRCECGHVWDGSGATYAGLFEVDGNATDEQLHTLAKAIAEKMNEPVADDD